MLQAQGAPIPALRRNSGPADGGLQPRSEMDSVGLNRDDAGSLRINRPTTVISGSCITLHFSLKRFSILTLFDTPQISRRWLLTMIVILTSL